ncbi:MAG: hypothetical protein H0U73_11480, partial [Tatlockia sp.]|nr:hypothetical protein [Tatlockia sp.]
MNLLKIASNLIPGYELLTQEEQETFENSNTGQTFVTVINDELLVLFKPKEKSVDKTYYSYFSSIYSNVQYYLSSEREIELELLQDKFNTIKNDLINEIKESYEYKKVVACTIAHCLRQRSPDFVRLTPKQQTKLARAEFSKPIQEIIRSDQLAKETNDFYEQMRIERKSEEIFQTWLQQFNADETKAAFKERIARKKGRRRAKELAKLFPTLLEQPDFLETPAIEEFEELYWKETLKENPNLVEMEEKFLTAFIFRYLKKTSAKYISYIDLDKENRALANIIAKKIIEAADESNPFSMYACLDEYGNMLKQILSKKLVSINNKQLQAEKDEERDSGLMTSLSYLFWHSKTVSNSTEFFNKMLDAHAFIQYSGASTQNESSYLVFFDLLNYYRSLDHILESKSILYGLIKPFTPLYEEYKSIGLTEKSSLRKIIRTLIPILIVVGVVIAIFLMFSPLALAEIPLLLIAIPAIILGLYLASQYVVWKDVIYQTIREKYYGAFETPEFQVNDRMRKIFGDDDKAKLIKDIYVNELKLCDKYEKEKPYCQGAELNTLTTKEIELRKSNNEKRLV